MVSHMRSPKFSSERQYRRLEGVTFCCRLQPPLGDIVEMLVYSKPKFTGMSKLSLASV
jgi:hypothetical protein